MHRPIVSRLCVEQTQNEIVIDLRVIAPVYMRKKHRPRRVNAGAAELLSGPIRVRFDCRAHHGAACRRFQVNRNRSTRSFRHSNR
jgi:hypothetical protein